MYYRDEIHFNTFMLAMRKGKSVTLERLGWGLCSISMLDRIEKGERLPDKLMRDRLMDRLGVVNDGFEDFLAPDEYALWRERQVLLQAIERRDLDAAEESIRRYERDNKGGNAIENQFYLAMKIQLMQYQGENEGELCPVVQRALALTVPDCSVDKWESYLLAPQEWNLLLEYIRCGGNVGPICESGAAYKVAAYEKLLETIEHSSMDIYSSVKIYPKAVCYWCAEVMKVPAEDWNRRKIFATLNRALEMLRSTGRMYYLCELLEAMERVLSGGEIAAPQPSLSQVRQWQDVLTGLFRDRDMSEKMESCAYLYWQMNNYSIGEVVRKRRKMLGLSGKELCDGICGEKTLRRLENNQSSTHMEIMGELFERLGLSPEYQRKKVIVDRYESVVLYETAVKALNNQDMETLGKVLPKLRKTLPMDILNNQQEMEVLETLYLWYREQIAKKECLSRLQQALEYTISLNDVRHMKEGYLSYGEILCVYNMATVADEPEKRAYIDLLQCFCELLAKERDIKEYITLYELIMYKVASYWGDNGEYEVSNKITDDILNECLSLRRMNMLHMCIYNRLWNQTKTAAENISAEQKAIAGKELRKCFQLAGLCKETFYETVYSEKLNSLCGESD